MSRRSSVFLVGLLVGVLLPIGAPPTAQSGAMEPAPLAGIDVQTLLKQATELGQRGDIRGGLARSEEAVGLARRRNDDPGTAYAVRLRALMLTWLERKDEAASFRRGNDISRTGSSDGLPSTSKTSCTGVDSVRKCSPAWSPSVNVSIPSPSKPPTVWPNWRRLQERSERSKTGCRTHNARSRYWKDCSNSRLRRFHRLTG